MSFNLAALFERVAAARPDRVAVVDPRHRLTYAALDDRAARLASHLSSLGIGVDESVGIVLSNRSEYLEAMLACFKLRAVPVNVSYRYVATELEQLLDDCDARAIVVERRFLPAVTEACAALPDVRELLVVDDGPDAGPYDAALRVAMPLLPRSDRSGDDLYCAYTGGTTGLPKGVLWRHEDVFFAAMGGGDPQLSGVPLEEPDDLPGRLPEHPLVQVITAPLMHVAAQWGAFLVLFGGGTVVLPPAGALDPGAVWRLAAGERASVLTLVGDAMARPLLDWLEARPPAERPDLSTLLVVASGGATLSSATKARIHELLEHVMVVDGFGSTEMGVAASAVVGDDAAPAAFRVDATTAVLDDSGHPVGPGSGVVGRLARRGRLPIGYRNDPERTAATFVVVDGVRWALSGDAATVAGDGTICVLGRDSTSINTGGEKVFAEEVEAVLRSHPDVRDAVVVGAPDERWGERVVAIVEPRPGATPALDALREHCRARLAGYKLPREVHLVEVITRAPTGKPDYRWAREVVTARSS